MVTECLMKSTTVYRPQKLKLCSEQTPKTLEIRNDKESKIVPWGTPK